MALTNPALGPISKMPEFKVYSVKIEKASEERFGGGGSRRR